MSINATLFGQMITFAIFVWFCMKFIWPRLMDAIRTRQKAIADGLAAADRSQRELEAAQLRVVEILSEAKHQAGEIVEGAQQRAQRLIEEAKGKARTEADRIIADALVEINQERNIAQQKLYAEVGSLAVLGAERIIERNITAQDSERLINQLISEVQH
jgi:F-type H+-transporting ATPase subunit b